jgi:hypothetical protein
MAGPQAAQRGRLDGSCHGHLDTGSWSRRCRLLAASPLERYRMARAQPADHWTLPRDQAVPHFQPAAKRVFPIGCGDGQFALSDSYR